jgi:hypothetical protein
MSKPRAAANRPSLSLTPMLASADGTVPSQTRLAMLGWFRGVLVTIAVTRLSWRANGEGPMAASGDVGRSTAAIAAGEVHGFPAVLTSFVGRAGAVREVAGLLEQYRLVTVTGPGGSGKTRLTGQVARQVADRFADGVWLAELAAVQDPAQVVAVVAAALGVPEQPGVAAADALTGVLARQQLLLVLDNCEHVIGAAA